MTHFGDNIPAKMQFLDPKPRLLGEYSGNSCKYAGIYLKSVVADPNSCIFAVLVD
jgi:hypothetical protein